MMMVACTCDEGLRFPHTHLHIWGFDNNGVYRAFYSKDEIRLCVDWKRAYRELVTELAYGC
jgi:hypothetical protein